MGGGWAAVGTQEHTGSGPLDMWVEGHKGTGTDGTGSI